MSVKLVVRAVELLKEPKGSTAMKIVSWVRSNQDEKRRDLVLEVRRALKKAVQQGLVVHRAGKYTLNNNQKHTKYKSDREKTEQENQEK